MQEPGTYLLLGAWVSDGQLLGVQQQASGRGEVGLRVSIEQVAQDGVAERLHVDAQLVGPACLRVQRHQVGPSTATHHLVLRDAALSFRSLWIHYLAVGGATIPVPPEIVVYFAFDMLHSPMDNSHV